MTFKNMVVTTSRIPINILQDKARQRLIKLANELLFEINRRAAMSLNADGQRLKPYSRMYLAIRKSEGLRATPNFQYSSAMLNSLRVFTDEVQMMRVRIGVSGVDRNGMPNVLKLKKVQKIKNYKLLMLTNSYKQFIMKKLRDFERS